MEIYNAVLSAVAKAGKRERAEHWLREMEKDKVHGNELSYITVIKACLQHGDLFSAENLMERMISSASIEVGDASYGAMVEAYGRTGNLRKAEAWMKVVTLFAVWYKS